MQKGFTMTIIDGEDIGLTLYMVTFVTTCNIDSIERIIPAKNDEELKRFLSQLIKDMKSRQKNMLDKVDGIIIFKIGNLRRMDQGPLKKFLKPSKQNNEINKELN